MKTILNFAKTLINLVIAFAIFAIGLQFILVLMIPFLDLANFAATHHLTLNWAVSSSLQNSPLLILLVAAYDGLAIFGLLKLHRFVKAFTLKKSLADSTYKFVKKATAFTFLLAIPQNILYNLGQTNHFLIDLNLTGYFFTALVILYFVRKVKAIA